MSPATGTGTTARPPSPPTLGRRSALGNLVAQAIALGAVTLSSLVVARLFGPAVLGAYALLRVLPWLTGVLVSLGLPVASTYHVAGDKGRDPVVRATLAAMLVISAAVTAVVWLLLAPVVHRWFLPGVSPFLLVLVAICAVTQLVTVWGKACCQGRADLRGANLVIIVEEAYFVPVLGVLLLTGHRGIGVVVASLVVSGLLAALTSMARLTVTGFFAGLARPSYPLAKRVAHYGARGQLGNLLWIVNLRLDFLLVSALAGPATLGVYAVATKFAELLRLPASAVNYVLFARFARSTPHEARATLHRLTPRAALATVLAAPVLAVVVVFALPVVFGPAFQGAVVPACVLLAGLSVEGATAVCSAYLWGSGQPGANAFSMGAGVVVTVALDVALIGRFGAVGAASASTVAYLVTTAVMTWVAYRGVPVALAARWRRTRRAAT
jgi:O-antigen/teichoic acid export membrane protein